MNRTKDHQRVQRALKMAISVHPHLRIGQLISNALSTLKAREFAQIDLFYIPDEMLAEALENFSHDHVAMVKGAE